MWKKLGGKGTTDSEILLFTHAGLNSQAPRGFFPKLPVFCCSVTVAAETWTDNDKVSDLLSLPSQRTLELCRPTKFTSPQCFMHCGRKGQYPGGRKGSDAQGKPWKARWRTQAQASSCGGPTLGAGLNC